jgi:hypothetical protein
MIFDIEKELDLQARLPDGTFSKQKSKFGKFLRALGS